MTRKRNSADHSLYALKDGRGVHISEVESGLACGCICGICHGRIVAHKGKLEPHHFQHKSNNNCGGSAETALHRRAIEILATLDAIHLPGYTLDLTTAAMGPALEDLAVVAHARLAQFGEIRAEPRMRDLCPDALVRESDGTPLLLEVVVTHDVDAEKYRKLCDLGYAAVAIVLPREDENLNPTQLTGKIREDLSCKRWIFHSAEGAVKERLEQALKAAAQAKRSAAVGAVEAELRETLTAMQTALDSAVGWATTEQLDAYRLDYRVRRGKWPILQDYQYEVTGLYIKALDVAARNSTKRSPDVGIEAARYLRRKDG